MKVFKLFAAIFVVAVVAALLFNYPSFGAKNYKKEVGFCANCHEMKPNYYTWSVTSHNNFGCLKCHQDIKITTFAYKHWLSAFQNPIEKKNIVPDSVCQKCHTNKRNITPPGNIIFPHQLHVMKQIDCVDCHGSVTHLNIAEHIKNDKNFDASKFNENEAKKLIVKDNQILMPSCLRCHNGDMASKDCITCHKDAKQKQAVKQ